MKTWHPQSEPSLQAHWTWNLFLNLPAKILILLRVCWFPPGSAQSAPMADLKPAHYSFLIDLRGTQKHLPVKQWISCLKNVPAVDQKNLQPKLSDHANTGHGNRSILTYWPMRNRATAGTNWNIPTVTSYNTGGPPGPSMKIRILVLPSWLYLPNIWSYLKFWTLKLDTQIGCGCTPRTNPAAPGSPSSFRAAKSLGSKKSTGSRENVNLPRTLHEIMLLTTLLIEKLNPASLTSF